MKFTETSAAVSITILANDHYAAIPYDCSELSSLASDGVIKAGTVIPANDETAVGILLSDVLLKANPNGTVVVHGFIDKSKAQAHSGVTVSEDAKKALPMILFS